MANKNIASLGRFSSQMLTYLGTQRTVKNVGGSYANTFKYAVGPVAFPEPGSFQQAALGSGVVGSFSSDAYDSTRSYFLSRGTSSAYADSMTALTIDIANTMGISPQSLLEQSSKFGKLDMSDTAYQIFNELRDPSHQIGRTKAVANIKSLQAREIRS